jgi:hypothetical protein
MAKSLEELISKNTLREERLRAWNRSHNTAWTITNMKGEEEVVEVDEVDWKVLHTPRTPVFVEQPTKRFGEIIYTPHDCEHPDVKDLPTGTIWECHGYTTKSPNGYAKMCYDKWIIVGIRNSKHWELFERSF